jgi:deoxyribodipyrimidine photo-lyase
MSRVIWWIRRDLRLSDSPALAEGLKHSDQIVPLFILDPTLLKTPASRRQVFLLNGLRQIDRDLCSRNSRLIVIQGKPLEVLTRVRAMYEADLIVAQEDYSPYASRRDREISTHLPLRLVSGLTVLPPALVVKRDGMPYTVFTHFSKRWKELVNPNLLEFKSIPGRFLWAPDLSESDLFEEAEFSEFPSGENEAIRRLDHFFEHSIWNYAENRDRADIEGTSVLSPYFKFGMLSACHAIHKAYLAIQKAPDLKSRRSVEVWMNELIWREFYHSILYHFPYVTDDAFNRKYRSILWRDDPHNLQLWKDGLTGYPIVDAAMRQLVQKGWMHNRCRMIVASFLVKDLLIDWREGERWFMQNLVDGDLAANNGGWQWVAGVGTDAAPYFRIFNPVLQSVKCDPFGRYIRRWVAELINVPDAYIHQPWLMPDSIQLSARCRIGKDYPSPVIDHAFAKQRTLAAYTQVKGKG